MAGKAIAEPKDVFGAEFDDNEDAVVVRNEEDELQAPPKTDNEAKAGLSEPQLIGQQSGTLFSDNLDFKGEIRSRKVTCSLLSASHRTVYAARLVICSHFQVSSSSVAINISCPTEGMLDVTVGTDKLCMYVHSLAVLIA